MMRSVFVVLYSATAVDDSQFEDGHLSGLSLLQLRVNSQDIVTMESCRQAATVLGLEAGGQGYTFEGNYPTKGCYTYKSGNYACHVYYGTIGGGDVPVQAAAAPVGASSQTRLNGFVPPSQCGYDCDICKVEAEDLGLELGGGGYAFAGDYDTKGCYTYNAGSDYTCRAYCGTAGGANPTAAQAASPIANPTQSRLNGFALPEQCKPADEAQALGDPHLTLASGASIDLCCNSGHCKPCGV